MVKKKMAKRKLYNIELKNRKTDPGDKLSWFTLIEAMAVSITFTKGYIACSQGYYPSPDIRVVDYFSGEIIEEIKGNSEVTVNKN